MDFNIDGEVKFPLADHLQSKVTFAVMLLSCTAYALTRTDLLECLL